jgi:hypothetical protein
VIAGVNVLPPACEDQAVTLYFFDMRDTPPSSTTTFLECCDIEAAEMEAARGS